MSRLELEATLSELKRAVVRATLRRKQLDIRHEALDRISLETPYTTLEAGRISPKSLAFHSVSGKVGRVLYYATRFHFFRRFFSDASM